MNEMLPDLQRPPLIGNAAVVYSSATTQAGINCDSAQLSILHPDTKRDA